MLKKIGLVFVLLVVVFLIVVATRPATFALQRSITVAAPPDVPYGMVADFHKWVEWSPWDALDPAMKRTFEGAATGTGAIYSWVGNDKVGEGRMTIVDARPSDKVGIKLEFIKPFASTNETTFTFKPTAGGTEVTWAMVGNNNFMAKAFQLFKDMDAMIGPDFEKGLATLKTVSEAEAKKRADEAARQAAVAEAAAKAAAAEAAAKAAAAVAAATPPAKPGKPARSSH